MKPRELHGSAAPLASGSVGLTRRTAPIEDTATFRPSGRAARAARGITPATAVMGRVALERGAAQRVDRLAALARDGLSQRRRATRPLMRALQLAGGGTLRWHEVPEPPPPGADAALVAPVAIATCDLDRPLGLGRTTFPLPLHLGHECVAEVVAIGSAVRTVSVGDRVVVPFQISCGACSACRHGLTGNCRSVAPLSMYGFGAAGGAWGGAVADLVAVPFADAMLVRLPDALDPVAVASAADTLSDAYRHVAPHLQRVREHPDGQRVVVLGAVDPRTVFSPSVPFYLHQMVEALLPQADLIVADARAWVRSAASRLGLDVVAPQTLRGVTAPLVVDCSTDPRGLRLALRTTAPDGICSSAGTLHVRSAVPTLLMFGRNVTLTLARSHIRGSIPAVLELAESGAIHPERVISELGSYDAAPTVLGRHLRRGIAKTVLERV